MNSDRRQQLLDQLDEIVLELFAEGLDEASEIKKRMVLHGLDKKRLIICAEVFVSPVTPTHVTFGVVNQNATKGTPLFEIDSTKHKPLVVAPLSSGSDAVQ